MTAETEFLLDLSKKHPWIYAVVGWVDDPDSYPVAAKRHTFEYLREVAHLRPRTNTFGAIARVRNAVSAAIHDFFQSRGFLYIHTPIITTSDCEGAGEMFQVTTLDLARLAQLQTELDFGQVVLAVQVAELTPGKHTAQPETIHLPEGIKLVSIVPPTVHVTIAQ